MGDIRGQKSRLSEEECGILGAMLKNGLKVFEHFHDFKLHSDDKIKPFVGFMTLFS
jgi:flagellar assembly factor FliW